MVAAGDHRYIMVDFAKLNDPEFRARAKQEREATEALQAKRDRLIDSAILRCMQAVRNLTEREAEFVRSVQARQRGFGMVTPAQVRWLADIEHKIDGRLGFITVTHGLRGHFAVHMVVNDEGWPEPEQSGFGSYKSPAEAAVEAREWASAEGLRCIVEGHEDVLLVDHLKGTGEYVESKLSSRTNHRGIESAPASSAATEEATQAVAAGRRTVEAIRARSRLRP